ncbi:class I SAM-dependent methyltransferase [Lentzea waywayandensis]|uniref:hypothetical protein n=1 Tax=Lentzea waywayandensis TaxID=84724 RepID=UPI0011602598|nr:hypothetical protein [Lentzea waywayandensis]
MRTRPTGVVAVGLLHLVPDEGHLLQRCAAADDPVQHVRGRCVWLVCFNDDAAATKLVGGPVCPRQRHEIEAMFDGLKLMKPTIIVPPHKWAPARHPVLAGIAVTTLTRSEHAYGLIELSRRERGVRWDPADEMAVARFRLTAPSFPLKSLPGERRCPVLTCPGCHNILPHLIGHPRS